MGRLLAFHLLCINRKWLYWFFSANALSVSNATAGLVLNGPRLIISAQERSTSVVISNESDQDCIVRVWISKRRADSSVSVPFIAMPALFRLLPRAEQILKVIKIPGDLPQDLESIVYLNAEKKPLDQRYKDNTSSVAVTERIALFYRPDNLLGEAGESAAQLHWDLTFEEGLLILRVTNPSAYYVAFAYIKVASSNKIYELGALDMLAPKSARNYSLDNSLQTRQVDVEFSVLKDDGGFTRAIKSEVAF